LIENLSNELSKKFKEKISFTILNSYNTNNSIKEFFDKEIKHGEFILESERKSSEINFFEEGKNFDISICYKKNGRGTILSNEGTQKKLSSLFSFCYSSKDCQILEFLQIFLNLFNRITSDSFSTFIIFEKVLKILKISIENVTCLFNDFPCEFLKRKLKNSQNFNIEENGLNLITPKQMLLDVDNFLKELNDRNAKCIFKKIKKDEDFLIKIYIEATNNENFQSIIKKANELIDIYDE